MEFNCTSNALYSCLCNHNLHFSYKTLRTKFSRMSYDRELHNLNHVLNRLSNQLPRTSQNDRGDHHSEPDSTQFLSRLEHLESQLRSIQLLVAFS